MPSGYDIECQNIVGVGLRSVQSVWSCIEGSEYDREALLDKCTLLLYENSARVHYSNQSSC